MRRGFTLIELLVVLVLIAMVAAILVPGAVRNSDRIAVEHQVTRTVLAYRHAWSAATSTQRLAILRLTPDSIAIRSVPLSGAPETLLVTLQPGPAAAGVRLEAPHTAVFGPDGVGLGVSNTTHVLTRGAVTRRITVSRLGRVRLP